MQFFVTGGGAWLPILFTQKTRESMVDSLILGPIMQSSFMGLGARWLYSLPILTKPKTRESQTASAGMVAVTLRVYTGTVSPAALLGQGNTILQWELSGCRLCKHEQ